MYAWISLSLPAHTNNLHSPLSTLASPHYHLLTLDHHHSQTWVATSLSQEEPTTLLSTRVLLAIQEVTNMVLEASLSRDTSCHVLLCLIPTKDKSLDQLPPM